MAKGSFESLKYVYTQNQFHGPCLYLRLTTGVRLSRKQMAKGPRYDHMQWSAVIGHVPVWLDDGGAHKWSVSDTLFGFGCSMVLQGQLGSCTELALFMSTPGMSTYAQRCVGGPYTNCHFPHKSAEGLQKMRTE